MVTISGLALSRAFFHDIVKGILARHFPRLEYAAALLGDGSEVLGLDDEVSKDHHWGPRLLIFLSEENQALVAEDAKAVLANELPLEFLGYSTNWTVPDLHNVQLLVPAKNHPVNHRVEFFTINQYMDRHLGAKGPVLSNTDWFTIPEQALLEFTAGEVFHDTTGSLSRARHELAFYPVNIWKALLASEWEYIAEEMAFVGRTGQRGDDIGSKIIASRLVQRIMRLALLLSKRYTPYPKWFGTAFKTLPISVNLEPNLQACLGAKDWREREMALTEAYLVLIKEMVFKGIIPHVEAKRTRYHGRDQLVVNVELVVAELSKELDERLIKMATLGSTSQLIDDARQFKFIDPDRRRVLARLYES
jgi:hypothetical protein